LSSTAIQVGHTLSEVFLWVWHLVKKEYLLSLWLSLENCSMKSLCSLILHVAACCFSLSKFSSVRLRIQ
jgi:hypothetical protein